MKGEAAEARTAAPGRGLAFAAAREVEVEAEAGAEMEVGRGWKRGVRTARAMAIRSEGQRVAGRRGVERLYTGAS